MLSLVPVKSPLVPGAIPALADWFSSSVVSEKSAIPLHSTNTNIIMGASTRAMSWCPISKTKIVILYSAIAAGTITSYFIRVVNFVNKKPVYSNPSFIASKNNMVFNHPMARIVKISADRLVVTLPENMPKNGMANSHTFNLLKLNEDDTVTLLSKTAAIATASTSRELVPQLPLLISAGDGRAWYGGSSVGSQSSSATLAYPMIYLVKMTGDTLTVEAFRGASTYMSGYNYPLYSGHRKDRKGVDWAVINAATAVIWNSFEPASANDGRSALFSSSNQNYYRNLIPIEGDKFIYFSSTQVIVAQFKRSTSNNYIESVTTITSATSGVAFNGSGFTVEDMVWVDSTTFVVIAGVGAEPAAISSNTINVADSVGQMSTDLQVFVFRFDDALNKVTLSPNTNLFGLSLSKQTYDSMLHVVDQGTVAAIGTFAPKGTANTEHQILMLKPV